MSIHEPEEPEELPLVLDRDRSLGWRLQTGFREFLIRRNDNKVFMPSQKKPILVQTSYRGVVCFEARRFPSGEAYNEFASLDSFKAVERASGLPVVMEWTEDLGALSENGANTTRTIYAPIEEPGFYLIAARARYAPVVATTQIAVVAEKVLTWASAAGVYVRVVDREAGKPAEGARLHGAIAPRYSLREIAPQFYDGTRAEQFLSGLSVGFKEGKRDELLTDNDEFLAGFAEGLKLREKYPQDAEKFEVATDADAVEENRLEDARTELVGAVEMADFEEAWIGCDEVPEECRPTRHTGDDPARFRRSSPVVLGFKPDRTGEFVAPAAYLEVADGAPPAAAAPPFPFRVVEADALLPVREAEFAVDESVRRAVAEGLKLVPAEHLAEALGDRTAHLDLRPLVIGGLLRSTAPEAPDAYARIAWLDGGVSLEVLEKLIQWRTDVLAEEV